MEELTDAQLIEVFHLQFLQVLTSRASDWFALKGGANLRYFFDSVRYSNDIDLDFSGREPWSVGDSVDKVLEGAPLGRLLQIAGIEVSEVTKPKQSDTTRRWKLGLKRTGGTTTVRTKIEFSGRGASFEEVKAESVPQAIVDPYGQQPPLVPHYTEAAATEQKIAALALRSETEARDIFDLDLLFRRRRANKLLRPLESVHAGPAADNALQVGYTSFRSEVLPFLDPEIAELYDSEEVWERMRSFVADNLYQLADTDGLEPR